MSPFSVIFFNYLVLVFSFAAFHTNAHRSSSFALRHVGDGAGLVVSTAVDPVSIAGQRKGVYNK